MNTVNKIGSNWEDKYPGLTKGIGKLKGVQVKLRIDESVRPVAITNRKIPFHMRPKIEDEELRLLKEDTIEKVPVGDHMQLSSCQPSQPTATVNQALYHTQLSSRQPSQPTATVRRKMSCGNRKRLSAGRPCKALFSGQHTYCKHPQEQSAMHLPPTKRQQVVAPHDFGHFVIQNISLGKPISHK